MEQIEGEATAAVIIKAAPNVGQKHGETVCVAGIDLNGQWHRLYPVPFKDLRPEQRFVRWDLIRFRWRRPTDDNRPESKRIYSQSLEVVGSVKVSERHSFARRALVNSLETLDRDGKTFGLIRPQNPKFYYRRRTDSEISKAQRRRDSLFSQGDFFAEPEIEREALDVQFRYQFEFDGASRDHQCIDWESEATFRKWRAREGEEKALKLMIEKFGDEWPRRGLAFAMGTHRVKFYRKWLLSAILRVDDSKQDSLL